MSEATTSEPKPASKPTSKPTSQRKVEANRRNAKKSTGPKTPEGKAQSSQNAVKHGLLARSILLPEDQLDLDHNEFTALVDELTRQYNPQLPTERLIVQRLAVGFWRLTRAYRYEAIRIMHRRDDINTPINKYARSINPFPTLPPDPEEFVLPWDDTIKLLMRYETAINRQIRLDMQYLEAQQKARGENPADYSPPNEPTNPAPSAVQNEPTETKPRAPDPEPGPAPQPEGTEAIVSTFRRFDISAFPSGSPAGESGDASSLRNEPTAAEPNPFPPSSRGDQGGSSPITHDPSLITSPAPAPNPLSTQHFQLSTPPSTPDPQTPNPEPQPGTPDQPPRLLNEAKPATGTPQKPETLPPIAQHATPDFACDPERP